MILSGESLSTYVIFYNIILFDIATIEVIYSTKIDFFFCNIASIHIINNKLGIIIQLILIYYTIIINFLVKSILLTIYDELCIKCLIKYSTVLLAIKIECFVHFKQ